MNIIIGSGFAETISKDIISNRNNFGNNFETIKKIKSESFFEELQKQNMLSFKDDVLKVNKKHMIKLNSILDYLISH